MTNKTKRVLLTPDDVKWLIEISEDPRSGEGRKYLAERMIREVQKYLDKVKYEKPALRCSHCDRETVLDDRVPLDKPGEFLCFICNEELLEELDDFTNVAV